METAVFVMAWIIVFGVVLVVVGARQQAATARNAIQESYRKGESAGRAELEARIEAFQKEALARAEAAIERVSDAAWAAGRESGIEEMRQKYARGSDEPLAPARPAPRTSDRYRFNGATPPTAPERADYWKRPPVRTASAEEIDQRIRPDWGRELEICFTGFTDQEKAELTEFATLAQMHVRTAIARHLTLLCVGGRPGPDKLAKAIAQDCLIVSADQFARIVRKRWDDTLQP